MRKLSDMRAKQGGTGRPVLTVLVTSMAVLAVAVALYMVWVFNSSPPAEQQAGGSRGGETSGAVSATGSTQDVRQVPAANPAYPAPAMPSADTPVRQP